MVAEPIGGEDGFPKALRILSILRIPVVIGSDVDPPPFGVDDESCNKRAAAVVSYIDA